ncbi:MAG: DNA topoisomerase I, partial [Alphaproteobacteria bacterium]|nr:DNA topoisomerase I [Alphaproteobacteria bacterium]
ESITLEQALGLLSLPRRIGLHPETKEPIEAGIGRFGPYVRMGGVYGSLDRDDDVLAIGINRAVDVLAKKLASVRPLGPHPADREPVIVRKGRFGPYVQHGQTVANIPRDQAMDDVTLEQAVTLLAEKGKSLKPKGRRKAAKAAPAAGARARTEAATKPRAKAAAKPRKTARKRRPAAKAGGGKTRKAAE